MYRGIRVGRVEELEKKRFICSECGAEYYLQAWKAVCPKCKSEYTLTFVEEREERRKILTAREWASILIIAYMVYSFLTPSGVTLFSYLSNLFPQLSLLIYLIPLLAALFLYLGTDGGIILSITLGALSIVYGIFSLPTYGILSLVTIIPPILWIIGSLLFYSYMRSIREHQEKVEDARELEEYSGWAGEED